MRLSGYVIAAITAISLTACDLDKCSNPGTGQVYTELNWVGTEVVYGDIAGKRDLSIIFFMADWCGWCRRLKQETLADSTVVQILGESYNIVYIDYQADSTVLYRGERVTCGELTSEIFGVRGFPSMAFCDRNGDLIGMAPGYKSVTAMIELLEMVRDGDY
jgi:thioredoxin-related protein